MHDHSVIRADLLCNTERQSRNPICRITPAPARATAGQLESDPTMERHSRSRPSQEIRRYGSLKLTLTGVPSGGHPVTERQAAMR